MVLLTELLLAVHTDPNVAQVIDCDPSSPNQALSEQSWPKCHPQSDYFRSD